METRLPGIVFVIIHGTASRGARWTRPESKIRRRLERHFNRRGRTFSFEWCGANTDTARLTAGKELGRRVLELYDEYHAPIYLVAHSHGGNIALYAMRDSVVEEKVAGVICIGTSFIHCTPRPVIATVEKCLGLLPRVLGATALGVIALLQPRGVAGGCGILLLGSFALARPLLMPWYQRICGGWVERLRGRVEATCTRSITTLSLPSLPNLKMLCLTSPYDEVGKCLRLSLFFSELPFLAWWILGRLGDVIFGGGGRNALTVIFYTGVAAGIAGMLTGMTQGIHPAAWLELARLLVIPRLAGLISLLIAPALILVWQLILAITPDLPGVFSHHVNRKPVFADWCTRITVDHAPEGHTECLVKEMNVVSGKLNFRAPNIRTFFAVTAHVRLYNNRGVLREIMRWIYEQEASGAKLP